MDKPYLTSVHGRKLGIAQEGHLVLTKTGQPGDPQEVFGASVVVTVTSAQLLALNATPQTVLAAQGAGIAIIPRKWAIRHGTGTAYGGIAGGEDLVLKYTDASGAQAAGAIETTGFLDQTTAQIRVAGMAGAALGTPADITPVANAALVIHLLSGEITTGDYPILVKMWYDLIATDFTA